MSEPAAPNEIVEATKLIQARLVPSWAHEAGQRSWLAIDEDEDKTGYWSRAIKRDTSGRPIGLTVEIRGAGRFVIPLVIDGDSGE